MDLRPKLMHWIGANSAESYWEVAAPFIADDTLELKAEAIVALEQLGAPKATKAILKQLRKEKDERAKKNLLRALGACGRSDKKARKELLDAAEDRDEPLLRENAIIALAWLDPHEDVRAFLAAQREEVAAVLAMGLTRDAAWIEPLEEQLAGPLEAELEEAIRAALQALKGGDPKEIRALVAKTTHDEIPRERVLGSPQAKPDGGQGEDSDESRRSPGSNGRLPAAR